MSRKPSDYDSHIAMRLKAARKQAGISQERAAEILDLTFQQIQKYEKATNRISAGNLFVLANAYGLPISWFYDGLGDLQSAAGDVSIKLLGAPHGADLARDYLAIKSVANRKVVADTAAAFARNGADQ